jgi:hypothetical protein
VESKRFLQGKSGLVITVVVVSILLVFLPAYRWFFLISVVVGQSVAGNLYLWHRLKPIQPEDFEDKRPMGLE